MIKKIWVELIDSSHKQYSTSKVWIISGAVWMVVGTLAGLVSAIHLVAPDFFANIPWLEFGRIRPVHTNTVLFGFVIISYEGTILLGSIAAFISVLAIAKLRPRKLPSDYSPRFSGSEFGIEVQLKGEQKAHVIDILRKSGAQEIDEPG